MLPNTAPIPAATQRSILLLSFATFSSMVAQRICDAMLPELSRSFDASLAQAAQVVSMFAIVYGVAQLVYGPLGDRLGKFRIVAWATLACGIGSALAVFAGSLNLLVLARMATGLAAAAIIPLSMAWIGDNVRFDQLQETLARVGLGTTLGIGGGQLIGGLMTNTLGWRWAFVVLALLFGVVGALLLHGLARSEVRTWRPAGGNRPADAAHRPRSFFAQTLPIRHRPLVAGRAAGRVCRRCGRLRRAGDVGDPSAPRHAPDTVRRRCHRRACSASAAWPTWPAPGG